MATNRVLSQKSRLQKVLECPLCLHELEQPQQLSCCFHAFCNICLTETLTDREELPEGFLCPVCQTFGTSKEAGEGSFLADLLKLQNCHHTGNTVLCRQCPTKPRTASAICQECKFELCDQCKGVHVTIPYLTDHHVVDFGEEFGISVDKLFLCENHGKPLELNCRNCDKLICLTCILFNHNTHSAEPLGVKEERLIDFLIKETEMMFKFCKVLQRKIHLVRKKMDETDVLYDTFLCKLESQDNLTDALKERLKNEAMEVQSKEIKSLETTKCRMECQLTKGEHLQNLSAVILHYSKSASRIDQIKSGFLAIVQEFNQKQRKDKVSLKILLPRFSNEGIQKFETYPDNVTVSPFGHVVQFEQINFNYAKDFGRKLEHAVKLQDLKKQFRITCVNDRLWVPQDQSINIYHLTGEPVKVVKCNQNVAVVKQAHNGHILLAGTQGLSYRISEEAEAIRITEGHVSDISCHGFEIAIFKVNESTVEIYELDDTCMWDATEMDCHWKLKTTFKVQISSGHPADTLLLTEGLVYFSTVRNKRLLKYTKEGILLDTLNLHVSCLLSGIDVDNNILLSRFSKTGGFRVLNTDLQCILDDVLLNDILYPLDAVTDIDHNVWILQECPGNTTAYRIVKLVVK